MRDNRAGTCRRGQESSGSRSFQSPDSATSGTASRAPAPSYPNRLPCVSGSTGALAALTTSLHMCKCSCQVPGSHLPQHPPAPRTPPNLLLYNPASVLKTLANINLFITSTHLLVILSLTHLTTTNSDTRQAPSHLPAALLRCGRQGPPSIPRCVTRSQHFWERRQPSSLL